MKTFLLGLSGFALVFLFSGTPVLAQQEAPSAYLESIETETDTGGAADEADAAVAQADVPQDESVVGLADEKRQSIEQIVVTARKRAELLEETPISVTALSENSLRESNVTRLNQITELVPNLQFDEAGGTSTTARVFIRGIGINDTIMTNQPGVGIYVDGVYMARSQGSVLDVVDVAQLEVLRGPQGTLFGKNTAGGAINITTVKPQEEFGGWVQLRPGNFGRIDTRLVLNVPIDIGWFEDKLFTRFSFASLYNEGYQYNAARNDYWSNQNSLAFQGAIRFLPTDDIVVDISGNYSRNHAKPRGGHCFLINPDAPGLAESFVPGFSENCNKSSAADPLTFYSDINGLSDLESYGVWATIEWDLADLNLTEELSLKSITAWRAQTDRTSRDFDLTDSGVIRIALAGGPLVIDGQPFTSEQFSQEIQLIGRSFGGDLSWVGGLYYLADEAREVSGTDALYGGVAFVPGSASVADRKVDNYTVAAFGQATWDINDWLSATAGLRWTLDHQGYAMLNWELADRLQTKADYGVQPRPGEKITQNTDDTKDFSAWTPMASIAATLPEELQPEPLDHLMGYFTFSQGFKGGGFNARAGSGFDPTEPPPTFDPEYVDSFEVGLKTIWFDRRLTANASFFFAKYTDMQVLTILSEPCPPGSLPGCVKIIPINANAADSTVKGAEFEFTALPIDGLTLTWNVGLLDSGYDDFITTSQFDNAPINRADETFNNVPAFNTLLAAQYSFPVEIGAVEELSGWVTPRIEWYYRSAIHLAGPELESSNEPGVGLLNARLSYDFSNDRAQIALWARNLTNEIYGTDSIPVTALGFDSIIYSPPRTFGAELSYRF
jgi:iron complex outermembrane receptor protein